ncbi:cell division protein FtsK [Zhengella mangrovi]|uniref:DNA translocase FtsK n=1 Tax=Zhengella mangrovi TaxID=1982044 RepID=A0A2G1QSQ5_9HYPH|nr:DNA translocase FtsK [Zhengella mangrovi]PHP68509.1 cell division protein FtsK [Zhengella mangrovi]
MRSGGSGTMTTGMAHQGIRGFARRQVQRLGGIALLAFCLFAVTSLASWNVADPSWSHATGNVVTNAMGYPGAVFSDLAMQFFGLASVAALVPAVLWGLFMLQARVPLHRWRRGGAWAGFTVAAAGFIALIDAPVTWPLPLGLGGVSGDLLLKIPGVLSGGYPTGIMAFLTGALLLPAAAWFFWDASGLKGRGGEARAIPVEADEEDGDFDEDDNGFQALGLITHWWLSAQAHVRRLTRRTTSVPASSGGRRKLVLPDLEDEDDEGILEPAAATVREAPAASRRVEPAFDALTPRDSRIAAPVVEPEVEDDMPWDEPSSPEPEMRPSASRVVQAEARVAAPSRPAAPSGQRIEPAVAEPAPRSRSTSPDNRLMEPIEPASARVAQPASAPQPGARVMREAQGSLITDDGSFELPSLHFLSEKKTTGRDPTLSDEALEQNARLLEGVLDDFGVKGEIIQVRPGPVVTLYELEPAPGIKSSRVIGLADDIARSMSAIAARVAVVPGRNAIGIELPNSKRETVYLRELLASRDFEGSKAKLALTLGKTINGEAVIADLAKMPHLLVAGTTGSGKSVAINTMILSLLYRMTPEQCRLIMIDPKMLELSIYDGIPHLLTPVVTDPKKAVVALKWTVREMEDRYRKMSKVGVRNIDGFNQRIAQAERKGESITRTVQTGFDRETGEAIYETEDLDLEAMPYIVVIIDEMADLMMVAGKEIEGAVQRLAQMARAAGIHVVMATQRPSVDVITGTIKANFPTRISFQVTSKIDSRTILGEQGAEQLLGMGDMLYMAGGGRIQRVHGPFVSDEEVEHVVSHLKLQGVPEYLDSITEEDEEDAAGDSGGPAGGGGGMANSDDPYDQAVAVVLRDGKASTSYIQRRLGIGYNRAASIIEKMEDEGIVGPANHAGKREILVPRGPDAEEF